LSSATQTIVPTPPHRCLRRLTLLTSFLFFLIGVTLISATAASAGPYWGIRYLVQSSSVPLDGSRAYIDTNNITPDIGSCMPFSTFITGNLYENWYGGPLTEPGQLQVGLLHCYNQYLDGGTCNPGSNLIKFVEALMVDPWAGTEATCTPEGNASYSTAYKMSVTDAQDSGFWTAYVDSASTGITEGKFVEDNQQFISEGGEDTFSSCTSSWSAFGYFDTWQRWLYSSRSWYTMNSSSTKTQCGWSILPLVEGSFTAYKY